MLHIFTCSCEDGWHSCRFPEAFADVCWRIMDLRLCQGHLGQNVQRFSKVSMFCWCNYLKHLQAQDFLSKAANENKAIEFRLESQSTKDICNLFSNSFNIFSMYFSDCSTTCPTNHHCFLFFVGHNIISFTNMFMWKMVF